MSLSCEAESLDGHEHTEDVAEYMGICVRGHWRRGMACSACVRQLRERGPAAVTCAACPDDDPRPRVLIPADVWDEAWPDGWPGETSRRSPRVIENGAIVSMSLDLEPGPYGGVPRPAAGVEDHS